MSEIPEGLPKWIADHVELYLTDPDKAHLWDASLGGGSGMIPTLLLITKGAKSGKQRMLPLIYKQIDGNFVIVASKGGAPSHPGWYRNLQAYPDCEIKVGRDDYRVRARTAQGAEREKLWDEMVDLYAPYTQYQERTDREIPVVVLEPQ
ncbi:MAG: nitroreductase family deazaflavin-dependent oxidoreductase [Pseudomonadales bacterium]|nr:nitroreductase family deazaflavin-dependent oxidoreductase [Pseudomonadales bacterium]